MLSNSGSGGDVGIAKGIDWLAEQGCRVISLSLGSPQPSSLINDAINAVASAGILVFAAAGNDGRRNNVDWPGASTNAIAVGAHDRNLDLASFSDRGPQVVTASPGVRIYGCSVTGYTEGDGTSFSCPFTAACALWVIAFQEHFLGSQMTITATGFKNLVRNFNLDRGQPGRDDSFGDGLFDVLAYAEYLAEKYANPDPEEPKPEPPKPQPGSETVATWEDDGYAFAVTKTKK